ncbi:MAG: hypothetical protein ABEJ72_05435, partial [Candidatus Aenigmatarchaeota archaeon]
MNASRAIGGLLVLGSIVVAVLHIGMGYIPGFPITGGVRPSLEFALPITFIVLVACGLGGWLGWIMAT